MAINYTIAQHATAYPSKLLATNGGKHIYNIYATSDTDNGNLVAKGAWREFDLYTEAAVTTFAGTIVDKAANGNWYVEVTDPGDALLVYNTPLIAEEYSHRFTAESNFYNPSGSVLRAHELAVGDIFEVSADAFTGTPAKDATISTVTAKKLVISE